MRKEKYVDGLLYELKNPEFDANGQIVSSEFLLSPEVGILTLIRQKE